MKTTQKRFRQTITALVALAVLASVFSPVGIVAAVEGIGVTQTADSTTVDPGDTIEFTTTVDVDGGDDGQIEAASIGLQEDLPDGWTVESRESGENFITGPDGWLWFAGPSGVDGSDTVTYTVQVPSDAAPGDYTVSATASTEGGESTIEENTITVQDPDANTPPTIDAIADQTVTEDDSATVDVTTNDADGDDVSLSVSSNVDGFVSVSTSQLVIEPQSGDAGTYEVTVTADDDNGGTATETFQLTVEEPQNSPPEADAGDDQTVDEEVTVVLNGADSSDDGTIVSYSWTQTGGPSVDLSGASSAAPSFDAPDVDEDQTLTFELTVTDDDGATDTDTVSVTVQDSDADPPGDSEVSVALEPAEASVGNGGTTTVNVVVDGLDGDGVGAGDLTVSTNDAAIVSVDGIETTETPSNVDTSVAGDGSSATIDFIGLDSSDTGEAVIAEVTITGESVGSADLSVSVDSLGSEDGDVDYVVTSTEGATVTVEPAEFLVEDLEAPDSAAQGETITVTADVENDGAVEVTKTVDFRFDLDGDGTIEESETVASEEVTLSGDASTEVEFSVTVPADAAPGEYDHGVFTEDDSATGTIEVTLPPIGDFENPPQDLDGDGLYMDVNGDNSVTLSDVLAIFLNRDSEVIADNPDLFDYNQNGVYNIVDIQKLFNVVSEQNND